METIESKSNKYKQDDDDDGDDDEGYGDSAEKWLG
jgi:hypothetical protein